MSRLHAYMHMGVRQVALLESTWVVVYLNPYQCKWWSELQSLRVYALVTNTDP